MRAFGPHSVSDLRDVNNVFRDLERHLNEAQRGYEATNYTPTRTLDAGTALLSDVANVLATLIEDLKAKGRIEE